MTHWLETKVIVVREKYIRFIVFISSLNFAPASLPRQNETSVTVHFLEGKK